MRWQTFILIWLVGILAGGRLFVFWHNTHLQPQPNLAKINFWEDIIFKHPHYADGWEKLHDFWQPANPQLARYCHQQAAANAPQRFAN